MVIKNIIKSETEPATNCLWLKDNALYHHNNGEWVEVDLNTVQGVEKLNRDVSDLTTQLQLMRDDYIGVWDELNNVKEILAAVQSGELANLLSQLGYDEQDIDSFVEANLHLELGITVEDVRQSVDKWNNLGYFIYKRKYFDALTSGNILNTKVAPKWTKEMDEKGLSISYTGDLGTVQKRIDFDYFTELFNSETYYPYIYHRGVSFHIGAAFIDKADIVLYEYHNPEEGIDLGPDSAHINVTGINELNITNSSYRIPIVVFNFESTKSFRRLGKSNLKSTASFEAVNLNSALAGKTQLEMGNLDLSKAVSAVQVFSSYNEHESNRPSSVELENFDFIYGITLNPPLVGYWDLCTVANNMHKVDPSNENLEVAQYAFYLRQIKNSDIYMNKGDGRVLEGCCLDNTNIHLEYSDLSGILDLFSYMGVPVNLKSGFGEHPIAHIYINSSGNLSLDASAKFEDIFSRQQSTLPNGLAHPLVLHLPDIASVTVKNFNGQNLDKEWWIADLSSGRKDPIPINKMLCRRGLDGDFNNKFMKYFNTWGNGDGTILELSSDQNSWLYDTDKAAITEKGYTISIIDDNE